MYDKHFPFSDSNLTKFRHKVSDSFSEIGKSSPSSSSVSYYSPYSSNRYKRKKVRFLWIIAFVIVFAALCAGVNLV